MSRKFYMHTIDGKPAVYWPGDQICYLGFYSRGLPPLARSLKQIRREQQRSRAFRKAKGWSHGDDEYGYVIVRTP